MASAPDSHNSPAPSLDERKEVEHTAYSNNDSKNVQFATESIVNQDFPDGGKKAWLTAVGSSVILFCTLGITNSFGVFQSYYETHQLSTTSPSTIAWIGSIQVFMIFGVCAIGGPLFDRFGAKLLVPASIAYVFSLMMTSICTKFWEILLAQGFLLGLTDGLAMSVALSVTPQYFNKKRGVAMGLCISGSSIGGVVFPIALAQMFANSKLQFGWSVRICGFICLALMLPASTVIKARLPPRKSKFFLFGAFKELPYALLCSAIFLLYVAQFMPLFFAPTYAVTQGMSEDLAFYLLAILNGASLPGRIIPGFLADKYGRLNIFFVSSICTGILALCWQATHSNAAIIVWCALYGFFQGAIISGTSVSLASATPNPQNIGTYLGMGLGVGSLAALIGPPVAGAMFAHYGGFSQVSTLSGVLCLVGALLVIPAKMSKGHTLLEVA